MHINMIQQKNDDDNSHNMQYVIQWILYSIHRKILRVYGCDENAINIKMVGDE